MEALIKAIKYLGCQFWKERLSICSKGILKVLNILKETPRGSECLVKVHKYLAKSSKASEGLVWV